MNNSAEIHAFYEQHLEETVLPFWLNNSIDEEYGSFFTCFENASARLLSTDKYIWSQGRMAWVMSKLASMPGFSATRRQRFLALAEKTADFLMRYALGPDGRCVFLTGRDGRPKPAYPDGGLCPSIYADCFVVLGLARYALVSKDTKALSFANRLYGSIKRRVAIGNYQTLPHPEITGYRSHGINMICNDIARELSAALAACGDAGAASVFADAVTCAQNSLDCFAGPNGLLRELVHEDGAIEDGLLHGRYINPGHSLEDMWFVMHTGLRAGDDAMVARAAGIALRTFAASWDSEYGGILAFCDNEGGPPRGGTQGFEKDPMVQKVQRDWDSKLWWPHSEGLYALLLVHHQTHSGQALQDYEKIHNYVFSTFPNPAGKGMEWIQIRDRQGRPENKVVALPVKDPYHIIRNITLILDLTGGEAAAVI